MRKLLSVLVLPVIIIFCPQLSGADTIPYGGFIPTNIGGDCSYNTSTNVLDCSGTNGVAFGAWATSTKAIPSGVVVGTSDNQSLTNKDMSGAGNTWPTFNQNTTGTAAALAANGTNCSAGYAPLGVDASGNVESCTAYDASGLATAVQSNLNSHTGNTSNPHSVTATQIGLGNVDNTSDASKNVASVILTNKTINDASNTITLASTGTGSVVRADSPTLGTPALGTPSALVGTNISGTASGLTAGTVTTNANLTGPVTSVGNATTIGVSALPDGMTATTQAAGSNDTKLATNAFVDAKVLASYKTSSNVGSDLIINGGFDSSSNWTLGHNSTISGGKLNTTLEDENTAIQGVSVITGKLYKVVYTLTVTAGAPRAYFNSQNMGVDRAGGTFTEIYESTTTGSVNFLINPSTGTTWSGTVDDVSIYEITPGLISTYKHQTTGLTPNTPTVVGTGGTATLSTGSSDRAGKVTLAAAGSSFALTFNKVYTNAPSCVVGGSVAATWVTTNTTLTVTTTPGVIDYSCIGLGE